MRQFSSNDTSKWKERFGKGEDGSDSINTSTFSNANTTFSGTESTTTGVVGSATGLSIGDFVLIHQSRDGGDGAGSWELNVIQNIVSTTLTFKYPLENDYATTAQIVKINKNSTVTVNSGQTLSASAWNGSVGGIVVLLASESISIMGSISVNGAGYRAGGGSSDNQVGQRGEGTLGDNSVRQTTSNGNGAGGGGYSTNSPWNQGNGGGGGSNSQTNAENGTGTGGGGNQGGGPGSMGASAGSADLTTMVFGGGGGGGGKIGSSGGNGSGIVVLIAPIITISGSITLNGNNGTTASFGRGCGGSGAGGSCLIKGQEVALGSNLIIANGGIHVRNSNHSGVDGDSDGGRGGDGRIRVEYSKSISGSTTPTASTALDKVFNNPPKGGFLLNMIN